MGLSASAPWLSFYGNTPTTLRYPSATMHQLVRAAAKKFRVSKSTVHKDVTERLQELNPGLAVEVKDVLESNKAERHLRGGMATKEKYMHAKEK